MAWRTQLVWGGYALCLMFMIGIKMYREFSSGMPPHDYYLILQAFSISHTWVKLLSVYQLVFLAIHIFPIIFLVLEKQVFSHIFWKIMLAAHVFFDIFGHHYEWQVLQAFWHDNKLGTILVFLQSVSIYIPAYIASYLYAFRFLPQGKQKQQA